MTETREQKRLRLYREMKAAVVAGDVTNGTAARTLMNAGWSLEEAGIAISAWRTLTTIQEDGNGKVDRT